MPAAVGVFIWKFIPARSLRLPPYARSRPPHLRVRQSVRRCGHRSPRRRRSPPPRRVPLHLAGDEAIPQERGGCVDTDGIVGEQTEAAPRLLVQEQPVALDEEDRCIRRDGIRHDVVNAAVVDGECHATLPRCAKFCREGGNVEGLGGALDGCQWDFFSVTQDGMRREIAIRIVKAVHAECLHGGEPRLGA